MFQHLKSLISFRVTSLRMILALFSFLGIFSFNSSNCYAEMEEAHSNLTPWSGYWWPHYEGAILGPLSKYDITTGKQSKVWEQKHHPSGSQVPKWFGYCHAWAAASVMEQQPRKSRKVKGPVGSALLKVSDQKGWLAVSHAKDVANSYGDRFGDNRGSEDRHDLAPDQLWRLLKLYVKQQGIPLILDVEAGDQVWNYPIYAYRINYQPRAGSSGLYQAKLGLWMADDAVAPDFVGVKVRYQTYQFTFRMQNGSILMGSGKWVGNSLKDHPDFAWYPYVARPENPEVDYKLVKKMLTGSGNAVSPNTSPNENRPNTNTETIANNNPTSTNNTNNANSGTVGTRPGNRIVPEGIDLLSPLELAALVMNRTAAFNFDVSIDRFEGGIYRIGESFTISAQSEQAGYLYLLHIDPRGKLDLIYPQAGENNKIPAGKLVQIPHSKSKQPFLVRGPKGQHRVTAVVTSRPLLLSGLISGTQQQTSQKKVEKRKTESRQVSQKQKTKSQQSQNQPKKKNTTEGNDQENLKGYQANQNGQFRWHPSQRKLIEELLQQYLKDQQNPLAANGEVDIKKLLGQFAQDEVLFLVQ